jgi:hypothetical protein
MYAVNVVALLNASKEPPHLPVWLLLREIVTEQVVTPVSDVPGHDALLVRGDVKADRWNAIVSLIRKRFRKAEFPLYEKTRGSRWEKV